ncbi:MULTISPECIES: hypothetical protein [Acinetobacter]|uniref:hypothetical protein n=1 Tax=Acinetobacter TaxID=469 RepID=UPI00244A4DAA|nr:MULTISPECIES: hypothetical protein [Acinetobacter]MDH0029901.1 hypothetical protein [Acinetobacter sp. GD04021]MDH0885335.1 hypothetical protein [Acinetobacter sp. GD03873]MDH1081453.1 hypothetical protein [Acinetobacter sp. GD03983]MDH2188766.1 hypothetical protein [Acinetobacter sp. GD03645]MDH2203489.1 hypothetical protein [Acinetobacter sp. GD03647]
MFNTIKLSTAAFLCIFLTACGGGGGGSASTDSSYSKKITKGDVTYTCKSQSAADACESQNNCSACESSDNSSPSTTITAQCATGTNTVTATQNGCVASIGQVQQTSVCVGTSLRMLTGTGFTKQYVIDNGTSFSSGVTLNGTKVSCAS